jgi:hypothetical protein
LNYLLSHGSPDGVHLKAVESLAHQVTSCLGERVQAGFLGHALPDGARVLPLFLTRGRHLKKDVPALISASGATLVAGPADFPMDVARMAMDMAVAERGKQRAVMFALYRLMGARALMADLYTLSRKFPLPAIAGVHGQCDVESVLHLWSGEGISQALIQPVLLFPGESLGRLEACASGREMDILVGRPLSEHADFPAWLAGRFREAA